MPRIRLPLPATSPALGFRTLALLGSLPRRGFAWLPGWLPRFVAESALIVLSILMALAVDEWREQRNKEGVVLQSLHSFRQEILQNKARLDDILPYHVGMKTMLQQLDSAGAITSPAELRSTIGIEGLRPPFLLDTAWQTALATGALTYMDYETVSALSMTYTLQERFREYSRSSLPGVIQAGSIGEGGVEGTLRSAVMYLDDVTTGEEELRAVYAQALAVVQGTIAALGGVPPDTLPE